MYLLRKRLPNWANPIVHALFQCAAVLAIVLAGLVIPAAGRVGAEDYACDSDPVVFVSLPDGNRVALHQFYRASRLLPNGNVVTVGNMIHHLGQRSSQRVQSVVDDNGSWLVTIESVVPDWTDGTRFSVTGWLADPALGAIGTATTSKTGSPFTNEIRVRVR